MWKALKITVLALSFVVTFSESSSFGQTIANQPSTTDQPVTTNQPATPTQPTVSTPAAAAPQLAVIPKKKKPKTLRESERKSMRTRDSLFQALSRSDTSIN